MEAKSPGNGLPRTTKETVGASRRSWARIRDVCRWLWRPGLRHSSADIFSRWTERISSHRCSIGRTTFIPSIRPAPLGEIKTRFRCPFKKFLFYRTNGTGRHADARPVLDEWNSLGEMRVLSWQDVIKKVPRRWNTGRAFTTGSYTSIRPSRAFYDVQ